MDLLKFFVFTAKIEFQNRRLYKRDDIYAEIVELQIDIDPIPSITTCLSTRRGRLHNIVFRYFFDNRNIALFEYFIELRLIRN